LILLYLRDGLTSINRAIACRTTLPCACRIDSIIPPPYVLSVV